jgi:hypothetical protein
MNSVLTHSKIPRQHPSLSININILYVKFAAFRHSEYEKIVVTAAATYSVSLSQDYREKLYLNYEVVEPIGWAA